MAKLIIQPAGGSEAREHYAETIEQPVELARYADLLGAQLPALLRLYPSGFAPMWGVTPGTRGTNVTKYARSEVGDVVLFTGGRRAFAGGVLTYKLYSPELARIVWGTDERGQTWENIYLVGDVQELDIPYEVINLAAGYAPEFPHFGFNVLGEEKSRRVFEAVGPARLPLLWSGFFGVRAEARARPIPLPIGRPYVPANESVATAEREPFEVDPNRVDRGLRGHARTQNSLATFLRSLGIAPLEPSPQGPDFDLAWEFGTDVYVAEVKSTTAANEIQQLRLALGQILDYADQLAADSGRRVHAVIATELQPDERWIELALRHGVTLVSPDRYASLEVLMGISSESGGSMKCPQNDGGTCSIPATAMVVKGGKTRWVSGPELDFTVSAITGGKPLRKGMVTKVDDAAAESLAHGGDAVHGVSDGVIVNCSCGHTYVLPR